MEKEFKLSIKQLVSLEGLESFICLLQLLKKELFEDPPESTPGNQLLNIKDEIKCRLNNEKIMLDNGLSRREIEVLNLLLLGLTNRQTANKLNVCEATVKSHNQKIFEKLKVSNRNCLLIKLFENGYISKKTK